MKHNIFRASAACVFAMLLVLTGRSAAPAVLIPGGEAVNLAVETDGILVTEIERDSPAQRARLRAGDRITEVDGKTAESAEQIVAAVKTEEQVILTVVRGSRQMHFSVRPEQSGTQRRIGAKITDTVCGIGTVSYYSPQDGSFGALGHGISLPELPSLLPVSGGTVCYSQIRAVEKSESGDPGELEGGCDSSAPNGELTANTDSGIFGRLPQVQSSAQAMPVAAASQIHAGDAIIRCCIDGSQVREYSVRIIEVYPQAETGRELLLEVTDRDLLAATGGIVRGMSGSPIIQDGRLAGAVTHVMVDNPTKGYGIFIETMLEASSLPQQAA